MSFSHYDKINPDDDEILDSEEAFSTIEMDDKHDFDLEEEDTDMAPLPDDLSNNLEENITPADLEAEDISLEAPLPEQKEIPVEVENQTSEVSSPPARNMLIIGTLVIIATIFLYYVIFRETPAEKQEAELKRVLESQPVEKAKQAPPEENIPDIEIGTSDELPEIEDLNIALPPVEDSFSETELEIANPFQGFQPPPSEQETPSEQVTNLPPQTPTPNQTNNRTNPASPSQTNTSPPTTPVQTTLQEQPNTPGTTEQPITDQRISNLSERKRAMRKQSTLLMNSGQGGPSTGIPEYNSFGFPVLSKTTAEQITASNIGNTEHIIAQGKVIDAILETAINTDLPGTLRAVISRDIYAESGKNIIIPQGSRLVGVYNNSISRGQNRVEITWQRVLLPGGVDINVAMPTTDQLGRAGTKGTVDNKYKEIFTNSILLSILTVGGAIAIDQATDLGTSSSSVTTNTDGSTTRTDTGSSADSAVTAAVTNVSNLGRKIANDFLESQPTITIPQGTRIKVFVNQDIVFPNSRAAYSQ